MKKIDIANYVIYDLANRFNFMEHANMDKEFVDLVAENWHHKHFISIPKDIKLHHDKRLHHKSIL